ncbi:Uncharacterized protein BM_BM18564 [Brugia malayi]|uniref:Uncharacterized protein n=1 Tax=Brugia malayi TaxID=6279 RepID=A0A4E9FFH0_BRUMA|nr:Uncharacterized protein BM_BM18564 [Brugia malayi]VIO95024.1 Uncharacterized protein BM_BM18564 [Brugia malayi]
MNKLLIVFGLVILFVTPLYAKQSIEEEEEEKQCDSHVACYDQREPQAWCILKRNQSWTNKGCFCDEKRHLCVMERMNGGKLEYAYCAPAKNWKCSYD